MSLVEKNLKLLADKGIDLSSVDLDVENYKVEQDKSGNYIFRVKSDDKWIYLGSKYRLEESVNEFLKNFEGYDAEAIFVIVGFGTGYHVKKLLDLGFKNQIIVIEPEKQILRHCVEIIDMKEILCNDNLTLILYQEEINLSKVLEKIIGNVINIINVQKYMNYDKAYSESVLNIIKILRDRYISLSIENVTVRGYTYMFQTSIWDNIQYIIKSHFVNELTDLFIGKTAVVVSAGPSLSKNIEFLKEHQDEVIIICGSRNLKPLITRGIKPHIVCVLDAADMTYELAKEYILEDSWFLFGVQATHKLVSAVKKRIFFGNALEDVFRNVFGLNYDLLLHGGSVAHVCAFLSTYMGCYNVIFIGQDFAYTDKKLHDETAFDKEKEVNELKLEDKVLIEVKGNIEDKVFTDYSMNNMRLWLEELIDLSEGVNYINCTEGGAFIKGTKVQGLKETLEELKLEKIYPLNIINEKLAKSVVNIEVDDIIDKLKKYRKKLLKAKELVFKGKQQSEKMLSYYNGQFRINIDDVFKKLDEIDEFINNTEELKPVINLAMENIYDLMVLEEYRIKNSDDEAIKSKKVSKKCIKMYEALMIAVDKLLPLVQKALTDIKNNKRNQDVEEN